MHFGHARRWATTLVHPGEEQAPAALTADDMVANGEKWVRKLIVKWVVWSLESGICL
jgi:hypothetical protein